MIRNHHWHILAAAAIAAVLWRGIQATAGLPGPPDPDHFRDIAQAQATADGDPFADGFYKNEHVWYNPLVPWIVGGVSRASATPPVRVHLTLGPWLNIAGPAGIYVLGSTLLGPPAGISALFVYVFCRCNDLPSWTCATYSPWLFPSNFAQGLFFLALAALLVEARRHGLRTLVVAAVLSGLVLLAHTAPALILSAVAAALLIRTPARLATFGAITALVASPFLFWIVAHYHLYVRNAAPMEWASALPWPDAAMLLSPATLLGMALAAIGVLALWSEGSSRLAMAVWFAVCAGFMAYRVIRDSAHWYSLPAVVPAFHFFTYLSALLALLIGAGVWFVAGRLPPPGGRRWLEPVWFALAVALFAIALSRYGVSADYVTGRAIALSRDRDYPRVSALLRETSGSSDVYVANDEAALFIVGPAGRRTVAVDRFFSNPYVERETRARDRDEILRALKEGRSEAARGLLAKYGATRVVEIGGGECDALKASHQNLTPVVRLGRVCVFAVRYLPHS